MIRFRRRERGVYILLETFATAAEQCQDATSRISHTPYQVEYMYEINFRTEEFERRGG